MKKILLSLLSLVLVFTLSACSLNFGGTSKEKTTITVGASPVPHAEILKFIQPLLKEKGYELKIVEFTDYVTPNLQLQDGQIDANFFQHIPYLTQFNKEKKTDLVSVAKVHIEPLGVYSKKYKNIKDVKANTEIAIPNDPTNASRALQLLAKAGLIKVKSGDLISKLDITENKKNLKITELDAPQLPRVLADVDLAVINTNYALEAGLNPLKDSLALESKDSPYANIIAVKRGDENKPYIKALVEVLHSAKVKKFIEDKYKGSIIPAF